MLKIGISGCQGAMGRLLAELIKEEEAMEVVLGIDLNEEAEDFDFPVFKQPSDITVLCDVIIDFSNVTNVLALVDYCVQHQVAAVIATTGLSEQQDEKIKQASKIVPIFKSSNTSLGINVLLELVKTATRFLSDEFDIEVIEKHHNKKVDAPSGTAYMIASSINEELNEVMDYNYGRQGNDTKRDEKEIGIHSVRGGTIPGEHTVIFAGLDEVIEIKHTVLSKKIFAKQAIKAAAYISQKDARLYNMGDLINH